jgi:hypothetical protein
MHADKFALDCDLLIVGFGITGAAAALEARAHGANVLKSTPLVFLLTVTPVALASGDSKLPAYASAAIADFQMNTNVSMVPKGAPYFCSLPSLVCLLRPTLLTQP